MICKYIKYIAKRKSRIKHLTLGILSPKVHPIPLFFWFWDVKKQPPFKKTKEGSPCHWNQRFEVIFWSRRRQDPSIPPGNTRVDQIFFLKKTNRISSGNSDCLTAFQDAKWLWSIGFLQQMQWEHLLFRQSWVFRICEECWLSLEVIGNPNNWSYQTSDQYLCSCIFWWYKWQLRSPKAHWSLRVDLKIVWNLL